MLSDEKIQEVVTRIFGSRGIRNLRFSKEGKCLHSHKSGDSCASLGKDLLLFQVKHIRRTSIDEVLGSLARGILESRIADSNRVIPLLVLCRLGDKTRRAVRDFMSIHASGCGWGLIDQDGAAQLVVPTLKLDIEQPAQTTAHAWLGHRQSGLFSDLNQWMLKLLLLADAPSSMWSGPRQRVSTPTELHRVANVSVEKAHQFVRTFGQLGLIRQTRHGLAVLHRKSVIDLWFQAQRSHKSLRLPARWIFGEPDSVEQVFSKKDAPKDFAISGFEACRLLGILHAPAANREVYFLGAPEEALMAWDLEPCDERDAHFYLRKAWPAQSIMRGRLEKANLPVVDVLQAALDVCDQPLRGMEQSQYIVNHVLGWNESE